MIAFMRMCECNFSVYNYDLVLGPLFLEGLSMCECHFSVYNSDLGLGPLFQEGLSDISISAVRELNNHVEDN
jgi:hypothetical protein